MSRRRREGYEFTLKNSTLEMKKGTDTLVLGL